MKIMQSKILLDDNLSHLTKLANLLTNSLNFSYINYSNIAARLLRKSLKPDIRADAQKRDVTSIKFTPWVNGKPIRKYQADNPRPHEN